MKGVMTLTAISLWVILSSELWKGGSELCRLNANAKSIFRKKRGSRLSKVKNKESTGLREKMFRNRNGA